MTNEIAPPRLNIQFLDVPPSSPLTRVFNEDVGVPKIIFDNFFQFLNTRFGRYVDAYDEDVAIVYF